MWSSFSWRWEGETVGLCEGVGDKEMLYRSGSDSADVGTALGDVADPLGRRVSALQVLEGLDLQSGDGVAGDFEVEVDGAGLLHGEGGGGAGQGDLGHDGVFLVARHLADGPLH